MAEGPKTGLNFVINASAYRRKLTERGKFAGTKPGPPASFPKSACLVFLYLDLVEQTGRTVHQGKRGTLEASSLSVLKQHGLSGEQWQIQVLGIGSRYWRAVGCVDSLLRLAERLGQQWVRGLVGARELEREG